MGDDNLKVVQVGDNSNGISLIAIGNENRPAEVKPGSGDWQKWAAEAIRQMTANGKFRGREVVASLPPSEVFVDHIKVPKIKTRLGADERLRETVLSKIKQKLPFEPEDAMVKYVPAEQDNVVVMASERGKIDRHLAIYEKANLQIKAICAWPVALTKSYTSFFGRRKDDLETIVMLLDIGPNYTNAAICRQKDLLFAHSIPIGAKHLHDDKMVTRLVLELTTYRRHFDVMYTNAQIRRLIFLSGRAVDKDICTAIAEQLELPAQMGDCLAAVEVTNLYHLGVDRRQCQVSWATAFGLSLQR